MKSHAIITYSKIHHLVTEDQAIKISMLPPDGEAMLDGQLLKRNNIADIITIENYYKNFPQKKDQQSLLPQNDPKLLEERPLGINGVIRQTNNVFALDQIARGIKKYMSSTESNPVRPNGKDARWFKGTNSPQEILDQINKKIRLIQNYDLSKSEAR